MALVMPADSSAAVVSTGCRRGDLGVVVIGRNEGERLRACLRSLAGHERGVVYVDSGSTDGSRALAESMTVVAEELDTTVGFTAARARNAGAKRLLQLQPAVRFIQFVDGDCELASGWLHEAAGFLEQHAGVALVCGRRRERYPDRSVYNLLCDLEWDTPIGVAKACGGDAMVRVDAWQQSGGFREDLIAGEEPELCVRLRAAGWTIWRMDAAMTTHDAAMTRIGQWWNRCVRAGFAYAQGVRLHGGPPERHWVREARSAVLWAGAIPASIAAAVAVAGPAALLAALVYPAQVLRLALRFRGSAKARWGRAFYLVLGKFPELVGEFKFWLGERRQRPAALIEYK